MDGAGELSQAEASKRASWEQVFTPGFKVHTARHYDPIHGRLVVGFDELQDSVTGAWRDANGVASLNFTTGEWTILPTTGLTLSDVTSIVALSDGSIVLAQSVFKLACPDSGVSNGAIFRLFPGAGAWTDITRNQYCNVFCYAQGESTDCSQTDRYNGVLATRGDRTTAYLEQNQLYAWHDGRNDWVSQTGAGDPYGSRSWVGEQYYLVVGGRTLRQDSASVTVFSEASNYTTF